MRKYASLLVAWIVGCSYDAADNKVTLPVAVKYSIQGILAAEDEREIVTLTRSIADDEIISIKVHDEDVDVLTRHNKVLTFRRQDGKWENIASGGWVS